MKSQGRILIVDDEAEYVEIIRIRLETNGFEVTTAFSGEEGLTKVESGTFDVIILDVMMPQVNGFQVLKRLRTLPSTQHTPVIMLTARGESKFIMKAQEMGVTDYIIKSDSAALLTAVKRHLTMRH